MKTGEAIGHLPALFCKCNSFFLQQVSRPKRTRSANHVWIAQTPTPPITMGRSRKSGATYVENGLLALRKTSGVRPALHLALALASSARGTTRAKGDLLQGLRSLPLRHGPAKGRVAARRPYIVARRLAMWDRGEHLVLRGRIRGAAVRWSVGLWLERAAEVGRRT